MGDGSFNLLEKKIPISSLFKGLGLLSAFLYSFMLVLASLASVYTNIMKVLFAVMAVCAIVYSILIKRRLSYNPAVISLFLFAIFVLMTCFWAENKSVALTEASRLIQLVFVSISLYLLIDKEEDVTLIVNALMLGGLFMMCWSLYLHGITHIISTIVEGGRVAVLQANLDSAIFTLTNAILLYKVLFEKKYLYLIPYVIGLILLFGTGSRTGFIVTCVQVLIYIILKTGQSGLKFAIPAIAVLAVAVIVVLPRFIDMNEYGSRIESIGDFLTEDADELNKAEDRDGSLVKRKIMLEFGEHLIKRKPLQGYGLGHYEYYFNVEYGESRPPHSTYIQLMVGTGIVGTFLYYFVYLISALIFLAASIESIVRKRKNKKKAEKDADRADGQSKKKHAPGGYAPLFFCVIIMYLVNNLSSNMLTNKYPYVLFGLFAGYIGMIINRRKNNKSQLAAAASGGEANGEKTL
ncbi:MAG: O-antigen ligase family protein [Clostridia bacterium]|nr:O-antigen ligase family protein [Clostridia bacterium]